MNLEIDYSGFDYSKLLAFLRENGLLDSNSSKLNMRNCILIRFYHCYSCNDEDNRLHFHFYELKMHPSNLRYAIDKMRKLSSNINKGIYNLESFSGPVFIEIYSYTLKPDGKVSKLFYKNILSTLKEG